MSRKFIISVLLCFFWTIGFSQEDIVNELKEISSVNKALTSFKCNISYNHYIDDNSSISEQVKGTYVVLDSQSVLKTNDFVSIVNKKFSLMMDKEEKSIVVGPTTTPAKVLEIELESLLKFSDDCERIANSKKGKKGYSFKFTNSEYYRIDLIVTSTSKRVYSVVVYEVDLEGNKSKLEIIYTNWNLFPEFTQNQFSLDEYVQMNSKKKFELNKKYTEFRLSDQTYYHD